jgi:hypothetical protein
MAIYISITAHTMFFDKFTYKQSLGISEVLQTVSQDLRGITDISNQTHSSQLLQPNNFQIIYSSQQLFHSS